MEILGGHSQARHDRPAATEGPILVMHDTSHPSLDGVAGLSVRRGLVYEGELSPEIEKSDYFDYLVPFGQLLTG